MLRFLAASDIHEFLENLPKALSVFPVPDGILLAGDYEKPLKTVLSVIASVCPDVPVYAVRGNNDIKDSTKVLPEERILDVEDNGISHRILIVHGHRYMDPSLAHYSEPEPRSETPEDAPKDIPEDSPKDIPEDVPKDIPEDIRKEIPEEITGPPPTPAEKAETDSARKPGLFEIFLRFLGIGGNGHGAEQNKIVFSESTKEDPEMQGGQLFFSKERKKPSLAEHAAAVHADIVVFGHSHQFTRLYDAKRKVYLFNPGCLAGDAADLKEMEGASVPEELMPDGAYGISSYSLLDFGILEIDGAEIRFRGFRLPDR